MIKDKENGQVISGNKLSPLAKPVDTSGVVTEEVPVPVQVESNGPMDILKAMKEILRGVTWQYGVPDSPKIFKTVQIDDGQYERIINANGNMEETMGFPAAFVHFIDWHYLVQANRINEGRAELRIRFILNRLNTHDERHDEDLDIYYVAERINQAIQENIPNYECLQERCQLEYIDSMESFDYGLQPCWMTYEVWFTQRNVWVTRFKTYRKLVCPPFTNHADQDPSVENVNPLNHTNLDHPVTYDEKSYYTIPKDIDGQ